FLALIQDLSRRRNITVLLFSHNLHHVQQVCDRVWIFVEGKLIASGNIADLGHPLNKKDWFFTSTQTHVSTLRPSVLKTLLRELPVMRIDLISENHAENTTSEECTPSIVKILVTEGYDSTSVQRDNLTLEQIYQQYFLENPKFL